MGILNKVKYFLPLNITYKIYLLTEMQLTAMQQEYSTISVKWDPTMNMQGNVFDMI